LVRSNVSEFSVKRTTKKYRIGTAQRLANWYFVHLTELGLGLRARHVLSVRGRTSGVVHSNPVDVIDFDGCQWLVAPYGVVNWVRNIRTVQRATLRRGRHLATYRVEEVDAITSVPVIREYISRIRVTRAYWECGADAPLADLEKMAPRHPVFRLTRLPS
jgi:hypothetical protein